MRKKLESSKVVEQKGRSLVELLGVLAVAGVLSVAGLYGFGYAMEKWRENETLDRYAKVVAGARTSRILEDENEGYRTKYDVDNNHALRGEFVRQHVDIKKVISNVGDDDDYADDDRPLGYLIAPQKGPFNQFNREPEGYVLPSDYEAKEVEIWVDVRTPSAFSVHASNLTFNACKRIVQSNLGYSWGYDSTYDDIASEEDLAEWYTAPELHNDTDAKELCETIVKSNGEQNLVLWFGDVECIGENTCPKPRRPICPSGDEAPECDATNLCGDNKDCSNGCCYPIDEPDPETTEVETTTTSPMMTSEVTETTVTPMTETTTEVTEPECNEENKCYSDENGEPVCCSGEGNDVCVMGESGTPSCGCSTGKLYCAEDNYTGSTCSTLAETLTTACVWHTECIRWACTTDELMQDPTEGEHRSLEIPLRGDLEGKYPFCSLELLGKCAVVSYCDEPPVDNADSLWQHCPSCVSYNPMTHVCMGSEVSEIKTVIDQEGVKFLKHFYFKEDNEDEPCKAMVPTITTTIERRLKATRFTTETIFEDAKTAQICFQNIDTECIADECQKKGEDILSDGTCCPKNRSWYWCSSCYANPTYVDGCGVTRTEANTCCDAPSNAPSGCVGVGQYDGTAKPGFLGQQQAQCYTNFPMNNGTCCAMVCASEDGGTERVCCTGTNDKAYKGICCQNGSTATAACCEANGGQWAPRNALDSISDDAGRDGQCCEEGAYIPVDSSMDIVECITCPSGETNPKFYPAPTAGETKEYKYAQPQGGGTLTYAEGKVCCEGKKPYFDKESQSLSCCKNIYTGTKEMPDTDSGFPIGICCEEGQTGEEDEEGNLSCGTVTTIPETSSPYSSIPETSSPYSSIPDISSTTPLVSPLSNPDGDNGQESTTPSSITSTPGVSSSIVYSTSATSPETTATSTPMTETTTTETTSVPSTTTTSALSTTTTTMTETTTTETTSALSTTTTPTTTSVTRTTTPMTTSVPSTTTTSALSTTTTPTTTTVPSTTTAGYVDSYYETEMTVSGGSW